MPGKKTWIVSVALTLLAGTGCCGWCQRHCSSPAPVAPAASCCCQPCCCPPANAAPVVPVPAAAPPPPQAWNNPAPRPAYNAPNGCCPQ
jgi:hypothetical protein